MSRKYLTNHLKRICLNFDYFVNEFSILKLFGMKIFRADDQAHYRTISKGPFIANYLQIDRKLFDNPINLVVFLAFFCLTSLK